MTSCRPGDKGGESIEAEEAAGVRGLILYLVRRQASWLSTGEAMKVCSSERASALLFFVGASFMQSGARKIDTRQPRAVGANCSLLKEVKS
ncbi:hypothetical protein E2C01_060642 [Portunus trituberculatus]|uniref:Uncharacterized protein n=1 Tax=Portunus trituberculatus TaxID=210409 RepID=A0A5B7HA10_PORTR|nr:hypothetical protein [Portunus trituberculatus]